MRIDGHCPACGVNQLEVEDGGKVHCTYASCDDPGLIGDFLDDPGATVHVVTINRDESFVVAHTLRCRIVGMSKCQIHAALADGMVHGELGDHLGRHAVELDAQDHLSFGQAPSE